MKKTLLVSLFLLGLALPAHAEPATPGDSSPHHVFAGAGFDPAIDLHAGYAFGRTIRDRWMLASIEWTVPIGGGGRLDQGLRVRGAIDLVRLPRFAARARLGAGTRTLHSGAADAVSLDAELGLAAGYRTSRFAVMADVDFVVAYATHIRPTRWYRDQLYPDARTGWYAWSGRSLHAGVVLAARVGLVELRLDAGYAHDGRYLPYIPPVYATLGIAAAFGRPSSSPR